MKLNCMELGVDKSGGGVSASGRASSEFIEKIKQYIDNKIVEDFEFRDIENRKMYRLKDGMIYDLITIEDISKTFKENTYYVEICILSDNEMEEINKED